jgi:excisionase family DNA binding protein
MQSDSPKAEVRLFVDARLLTLPEAARYLGCTVWTVRELIWKGELHYTRFGKRFQVDLRDLDVLIDREKRQEGSTQPRRSGSRLNDFVVTSSPQGRNHGNGSTNTDEADGQKQKSPRRGLDIQAKVSSEKR